MLVQICARTQSRTIDERVTPSRETEREKETEREELALLHAELLNSALWLTTSAYSATYALLNLVRVLLSRKVDY